MLESEFSMAAKGASFVPTVSAKLGELPPSAEVLCAAGRCWTIAVALAIPISAVVAIVYERLGIRSMAIYALCYLVFCSASLLLYYQLDRGIEWFGFSSQIFLVVSSFVMVLILGGLVDSGGVVLMGAIGPLHALSFPKLRRAFGLFLAYFASIILAVILQPWLRPTGELPPTFNLGLWTFHFTIFLIFTFGALFHYVRQRNAFLNLLRTEQARSENLLLNILPEDIAAILKREERLVADDFDGASILFADLVGFTAMSTQMTPEDVVRLLNEVFTDFDSMVDAHEIEKIKTIGDCYMVAAGVPRPRPDHAHAIVDLALEMIEYVRDRTFHSGRRIDFRIGVNSGHVVAGVIGRKKFIYDLWGDAVNTASRMERQGSAGTVQITRATYELIKDDFICTQRGTIPVKGKGDMEVWHVEGRRS